MLYKFYSFTGYTLDALANSSVYFSRRHQFNDPMDCNPPIVVPERDHFDKTLRSCVSRMVDVETSFIDRMLSKDASDHLFSWLNNRVFESELQQIADVVGVFCLTNQPYHPLMWGHYSSGHQGFCVGFDIPDTELVFAVDTASFEGHPVNVKRVDYGNRPVDSLEILLILMALVLQDPVFRNTDGSLNSKSADMILNNEGFKSQFYNYYAMHHFSHKHSAWSYENELRALALPRNGSETSGVRKLKHGRIKEVIFGSRMPQSQRITVERLLGSNRIEYKQSIFSDTALELDFLPAW